MNIASFSEAKTGGTNEDALDLSVHPQDDSLQIVALADGQGGRSGGAKAAQTAVKSAVSLALSASVAQVQSERFWAQLLFDVDQSVCDEPDAGFTTFVGVAVTVTKIIGVSSGDSQALLLTPDGSVELLTSKQKKNPPVGSAVCHPVTFMSPFPAEAKLVVMSDGVYKFVSQETICSTILKQKPRDAIQTILEAAIGKSGTLYDDFSMIILSNNH